MLRRLQQAIATRHKPPRDEAADLRTRIQAFQSALADINAAANLTDAQTIAMDALSTI